MKGAMSDKQIVKSNRALCCLVAHIVMFCFSGDGQISIFELKKFLESIGEKHSEEELREMINKANPMVDGNVVLEWGEFLGMMAESEFYYLFLETFKVLDIHNSGFIKRGELKQRLDGIENFFR